MTFDSIEALKNYILSRSTIAIRYAQLKIFDIIDKFLMDFYKEFTPEVYHRTQQLLYSLVKSDITLTDNECIAKVYFDLDKLDYSIKTLQNIGTWGNTYKKEGWTKDNDAWVLETAMTGAYPHGDYASGTAIWTESMKVLSKEGIEILKQELIKAGIPVRK